MENFGSTILVPFPTKISQSSFIHPTVKSDVLTTGFSEFRENC